MTRTIRLVAEEHLSYVPHHVADHLGLFGTHGLDVEINYDSGPGGSSWLWSGLAELLPGALRTDETGILHRMQKILSVHEQAQMRAAAQLADIGYQAACHVTRPGVSDLEIYAAFTFAQMARGGESGDGYQIGVNQYGTACGKPCGRTVRSGDLINIYVSAADLAKGSDQACAIGVDGAVPENGPENVPKTMCCR